jgi:antitoxin component of MazEF toxin-antitoxin module
MMVKKLVRHGNSRALVIDRPILELLDIGDDTPLELVTDGRRLIVSPVVDEERQRRFEEAYGALLEKHDSTLKRLAE